MTSDCVEQARDTSTIPGLLQTAFENIPAIFFFVSALWREKVVQVDSSSIYLFNIMYNILMNHACEHYRIYCIDFRNVWLKSYSHSCIIIQFIYTTVTACKHEHT